MTPVTDPTVISQLEGSGGQSLGTPVNDPTVISQLEASPAPGTNPAFVPRVGADVLAGFAKFGNGLINTPHNIANYISPSLGAKVPGYLPNYNYGQALGVNNPNTLDSIAQGIGQYAPYLTIPAEGLTGLAGQGAAYGATQSQNPVTGAAIGAATNLGGGLAIKGIGKVGGALLGTQNTQNALGNRVLDYLNNASGKGNAIPPQEAAENLGTNYTGANGQPLNVDVGTIANNPLLKGVYQKLAYLPGTGVSKNNNIVARQLSDKAISDAQNNLTNTANQSQDTLNNTYVNNALNQTNARAQNSTTAQNLFSQLNDLNKQQQPYQQAVSSAPSYFNSLGDGLGNRANLTQGIKGSVADVFQNNKAISNQNYAPINNSTVRFDNTDQTNLFPNYASATNQLLANRENMSNLFDKDSDLSASLRNEIDKAQGVISNGSTYGVTLPEAVSRMQNLGQLQASANSQGRRYEGMLLGQLKDGLSTDVTNNLVNSGNGDLANQLQVANDYHKNNIVPFYQNNTIRKAVTSGYIPPKATLATALHDPNSQSILMQMPNEAQNASLYQLLSGGKGSSSGVSNLDAQGIGNAYSKLPVDTKTAVAQYNPQADQYFENLPDAVNKNQQFETAKAPITQQLGQLPDTLAQQLQKLSTSGQSQVDSVSNSAQQTQQSLQAQLEAAKQARYGNTPHNSPTGQGFAHAAEGGLGLLLAHYLSPAAAAVLPAGMALGRTAAKALRNPNLAQAYINGSRLPVTQSATAQALMRAAPLATTPIATQQGGQ